MQSAGEGVLCLVEVGHDALVPELEPDAWDVVDFVQLSGQGQVVELAKCGGQASQWAALQIQVPQTDQS
jgi:hypothetical protein